jgi:4-amino-4-deoxy-L-arabinose transferase-like glycosyltransferase
VLRFLSYNHIITYVALFIVTVVMRLPSFHPNYYQEDEAYYLTAGERIVEGGVQYVDTWDNKPPLIGWIYALFVWVFGSGAIFAVRVFTTLYLFVTAMVLNQFVVDNKLLDRFSLLPAFLYLLFCSAPWYAQELNGELLMNLPVVVAVIQLLKVGDNLKDNQRYLFIVGVMMGLAFMVKYQALFVFLGFLGAYIVISTPRLSETFSILSGFGLVLFVILAGVYLNGALAAYWDIGVVYNLDYILAGRNPGEQVSFLFNIGQYLQLWGGFFIVSLAAMVRFRLNFFKNAIRLRKIESVLLFWFFSALLTVILGGGRLYLHYFYLLVPVLVIYASVFFELRIQGWLRSLVMMAVLAVPLYTFGIFPLAVFPKSFTFAEQYLRPGGWVHGLRAELNEVHPLEKYIDRSKVHNGILVLAYEPTVYTRLDLPCATKYTNFSVAYYKFNAFRKLTGYELISRSETDADVYREFRDQMPEYIFDPLGLFPHLRDQLPVLLSHYKTRQVIDHDRSYKMYFL